MSAALGSASGELLIDIAQAMANLTTLESRVKGLESTGGDTLKGMDNAGQRVDTLSGKVTQFGQKWNLVGKGALGAGLAIAGAMGLSINAAANFEQSMSNVGAALGTVGGDAGLTQEQFDALNQEALKIGANTSVSATEAATAMELLAKSGLSATQILEGGAAAVVDISQATGESIDQSAASFGALTNLFADTGISASEMADAIVVGMNNSNATLSEFQTGISRLAPVIAQTGMSFTDSAAAIAYFNSRGFSAAEVGTSLTAAFNNLANPTAEAATAMQDLGIHAFDAQGNFVGFPAIMDQVAAATAGMTDEQKAATLATIFGADAMDVMADAAKTGGDGLRDLEEAEKEHGAAAEQSAARMDNLKGSIEQLKGAIESAMIIIGSAFAPLLRVLADAVTAVVNKFLELPKSVQTVIAVITAIAGAVMLAFGAFVVFAPQIAAVIALFSTGGALAGFGAAIAALAVPILIVVAALAALGIAYKTNFLGFADAVNGIASKAGRGLKQFGGILRGVKANFDYLRSQGLNPFAAGFKALGTAFTGNSSLFGRFAPIAEGIGKALSIAGDFAQSFGNRFNQLRGTTDTVNAVFQALGDSLINIAGHFGPLSGMVEAVGNALKSVGLAAVDFIDTFQALMEGDWKEAWDELTDGLNDFGQAVSDVAQGALNLFTDGLSAAWDALSGVDWGGVLGTIVSGLGQLGDLALQGLGSLSDLLLGWLGDAAAAVADYDWAGLVDGAKDLGAKAIELMGTLADKVANWITDAIVSATGYWPNIVDGAKDLAGKFVGLAGDLASSVANWITAAIVASIGYWPNILDGAKELASKFLGLAGDLASSVVSWVTSAIAAVAAYWPNLLDGAADLASQFISKAGDLATSVVSWVTSAIAEVSGYWPNIIDGAKDLAVKAIQAAGSLVALFGPWVSNAAIEAAKYWPNIIDGAKDLASKAISAAGNLSDKVVSWVTSAIAGVSNYWPNIIDGAKDLAGKAITAMGSLADKVTEWVDAAVTAAAGLDWSGIFSGLTSAFDAVWGPISSKLSDLKGALFGGGGDASAAAPDTGAQLQNAEQLAAALQAAQAQIEAASQAIITAISNAEIAFDGFVTQAGIAGTNAGQGFVDGLAPGLSAMQAAIATATSAAMGTLGSFVAQMGAFGTGAGGAFSRSLQSALQPAQAAVTSAVTAMQTAMGNFAAQAGAFGTASGGNFSRNLTAGMNTARSAVQSAVSTMNSSLSQFASQAASAGQRGGSEFASGVRSGMSQATSAAQNARSAIISALTLPNMYGSGFSVGQSLGQGLAAGLSSMVGAVQSQAAALASAAAAAINAAAQVGSPSRLTMKTGRWMAEGLEIGFEKGTPDVLAAFADLIPTGTAYDARQFGQMAIPGGGGTVSNVTILALKSEEWLDWTRKAETGADFAYEMAYGRMGR